MGVIRPDGSLFKHQQTNAHRRAVCHPVHTGSAVSEAPSFLSGPTIAPIQCYIWCQYKALVGKGCWPKWGSQCS